MFNPQDGKKDVLARILAHLMGDGCLTDRYLRYNNKNQFLIDFFERDFQDFFGGVHFIRGKVNSETMFTQVQNKNIISYLRKFVKDFRSGSLRMPKVINTLKLKQEFLRALFDDEGCVALRVFRKTGEIKRSITIASKSKIFLEEIKKILEKDFDIQCNKIGTYFKKILDKTYSYFVLTVTGKENLLNFRLSINFNHLEKRRKLDEMINSYIRK